MVAMTLSSPIPARGLIEVGCWAHARRYFHKALESDRRAWEPRCCLIAHLYRVEKRTRTLGAGQRLRLRQASIPTCPG